VARTGTISPKRRVASMTTTIDQHEEVLLHVGAGTPRGGGHDSQYAGTQWGSRYGELGGYGSGEKAEVCDGLTPWPYLPHLASSWPYLLAQLPHPEAYAASSRINTSPSQCTTYSHSHVRVC
jgi:hypothetical protein